ncbi:hypothetical protein C493_11452 [Natronolimnohabitans innermongolicus JCM 12255]|uniref:Uncharacterized protein n=2 Tax=Natronolimnohabitans innermongolicus TaxID=253107 RepID=L9X058_9EURY|nr:hypothetical protein C493_11452 [Natronolimnohabitans innermongolicus JCM 12255]
MDDDGRDAEDDENGGDDESAEVDPDEIEFVAACVDEEREFATFRVDNDNDESVTLTTEGTSVIDFGRNGTDETDASSDDDSGDVDHDEAVEQVNSIIEDTNERLENVDDVEPIDEIDANTGDDVQEEVFTQVVAEINAQSQELLGTDIAGAVDTPDEARAEADEIEAEYGAAAQEAVDGLNDAADNVEEIRELTDRGGSGDGSADELTVGADDSETVTTGLEDDTATVSLHLDGDEIAEATADYDEMDNYCSHSP